MRFRPCIDIHNGQVKQIVGGSLKDKGSIANTNYVSTQNAAFYAALYRDYGLTGGHIILLNPVDSPYYSEDLIQAKGALTEYPQGLQIGGGIHAENAAQFLMWGASHVIVTSYVFRDGCMQMDNLMKLLGEVGKEHLVLDLSCRYRDEEGLEPGYYIVTDRWQKFTKHRLDLALLNELGAYCDEFLIHAVDVEGKQAGIEPRMASLLGEYTGRPITYAGGIHSLDDLDELASYTHKKVDFTIGSALNLFGGNMPFEDIVKY